jgi:hypothetical protein
LLLENNHFPKVVKSILLIALSIVLCRVTHGYFAGILALLGIAWAFRNDQGRAASCYMLFPFLVIMNPFILPKEGICGLALRFGPIIMAVALFLSGSKKVGRHTIPIGAISFYLVVAAISSISGYAPRISFLKIVNFVVLIVGIWFGLKNIDGNHEASVNMRCFFLGMTVVLVGGSLVTLFFPAIGYLTSVSYYLQAAPDLSMEELDAIVTSGGGVRLFAGITNQSQCLAVLMPCTLAWLACDMLFVERRISLFHLALLLAGLPLVYMTRARIAFLVTAAAILLIYLWCFRKIRMPEKVKSSLNILMVLGAVSLAGYGIYAEKTDSAITKWLRKTEDVASDSRSFSDALTSSRMGLVEESLRDFRRNPLLGKGFQVTEDMKNLRGFRLSAPIEKGVLPAMILGETGVVGLIAFIVFLLSFYVGCIKRRLIVTMSLFTIFLACNMAEAVFFSPGGVGGILWVVCVAGGFIIDTHIKLRNRAEAAMMALPPMQAIS